MTTLYVTEYTSVARDANGVIQVPKEPETLTQTLANAGGNVVSAAFQPSTKMVRLHTDSICSVLFGSNPTATTANRRLAANQTEYVDVATVPQMKVAVILNT
jgi:hypothetical protein